MPLTADKYRISMMCIIFYLRYNRFSISFTLSVHQADKWILCYYTVVSSQYHMYSVHVFKCCNCFAHIMCLYLLTLKNYTFNIIQTLHPVYIQIKDVHLVLGAMFIANLIMLDSALNLQLMLRKAYFVYSVTKQVSPLILFKPWYKY
jgi:hypothetical protein